MLTKHTLVRIVKGDLISRIVTPNYGVPLSLRSICVIFGPYNPLIRLHLGPLHLGLSVGMKFMIFNVTLVSSLGLIQYLT